MSTDLVAVDLTTGEVLEHLEQQPPAKLAAALVALHDRRADIDQWTKALETELRRRLKVADRKLAVFGDWEVATTTSRKSVWDVEELEVQIESLVEQGVLKAGEVTEVIDRNPTVRAGEATKLIGRLDGAPKRAIEQTRTWKEQPGKLTVVRSVELAASEQGSLAPPPEAQSEPAGPAQTPPKTYDFFRDGDADPNPPTAEETSSIAVPPASTRPPSRPARPTPLDPEELFA